MSPWGVAPAEWFAGQKWGHNAGLRVWRRLLAEESPPEGEEWVLKSIAKTAVAALDWTAPFGPSDPWESSRWTAEVVTAAERKQSPFLDAAGRKLSWRASLAASRSPAQPFVFETIPEGATGRKVDGRFRLAMIHSLLERYRRERERSGEERHDHLLWLAEVATLLPNNPDNSSLDAATLIEYNGARSAIYAALYQARQNGPPVTREIELLRAMMRLHVASRSGPQPDPPFLDVVKEIRAARPPDDPVHFGLGDILEEMGRLRKAIGLTPGGDLAGVRANTDSLLKALLPQGWRPADAIQYNRTFTARLEKLTGDRLASLLVLETDLAWLLEHHQKSAVFDPQGAADDLEQLVRAYILVDYTIWYSRSAFNATVYFQDLPASPQGRWYPALVVLAWGGPDLQGPALKLLNRLGPQCPALATQLRRLVYQRNETAMATLASILERPDAAGLLTFRHTHETRTLNLRLLAEKRSIKELSAQELVRGAFDGVGVNLTMTGAAAPSDVAVWTRLFGPREGIKTVPESLELLGARRSLLNLNSVDATVRLAASCVSDRRFPEALRKGAERFLAEGKKGLLDGAESPEAVLDLAREIVLHAGPDPLDGYRKFYDDALTESRPDGEPSLSHDFRAAVAAPFYHQGRDRQQGFVTRQIDAWRATFRSPNGDRQSGGLALAKALRNELGPLVVALARGDGHPPGQPYLWQAADLLDKETGVREAPPATFFTLAAWWRALGRGDDPEPIHRMLTTAGTPDDDALARVYRRRCEREAEAMTRTLDELEHELRAAVPAAAGQSAWQAVQSAWVRRPVVRGEFKRLLACPRKYNGWASATGLSLGLAVPEGVGRKKWEALRPLWLPDADDRAESGWEIPAGDDEEWQRKGAAPAYEFLLLLRWLSDLQAPTTVHDWVHRNVAAERVREWINRAKVTAILAVPVALQGQYAYTMIPPGPRPDAPTPRVAQVLARLVWPANPPEAEDFSAFVTRKDALMCDLLELIAACDAPGLAVDWFVFGARAFPPFTALLPEPDPRSGTVRVMVDRPGSRVMGLFSQLNAHGDRDRLARLRDAVFWYQIDAMSGDGRLETPAVGWSGWIPPVPARPEAVPLPVPHRTAVALAREDEEATVPDNAWRRIIASIVDDLRKPGVADDRNPLVIGVDQPPGWILAFGTEELVGEVEAALGRKVVAARGSDGIRVVVRQVKPGVSVETVLRQRDRDLTSPRTVKVDGPWPPWFAARVVPGWSDIGTHACLGIAALGVLVFVWKLRRCWNDPVRGIAPRIWACLMAIAGLGLGLLAWDSGPVVVPGPRRGGVVEILLARAVPTSARPRGRSWSRAVGEYSGHWLFKPPGHLRGTPLTDGFYAGSGRYKR